MTPSKKGFTIVELLIVIVVIAILAAISIVAYNGIQSRANDSRRKSDLARMQKAIELYKVDNGAYPPARSDATTYCISVWAGTSITCWDELMVHLDMPMTRDPTPRDSSACDLPNSYETRAYYYATTNSGQGYRLGAYLESIDAGHSDYNIATTSTTRNCGNFTNYLMVDK